MSPARRTLGGRELKVLVVDDEDNISFVVKTALSLAGYQTDTVASGRDALVAVRENRYDLVLLDVMLGDLDGFEVCRRMRQENNDTPVLFLTAKDATADRVEGLTIGGDDYVTKPFDIEELIARVGVILRRSGIAMADNVVRCGDIELRDDAHTVLKAGDTVELSPTEFKLLQYLMRNQGKVLSKGQLIDAVWGYEFDTDSTVVETFISSLRKKIDYGDVKYLTTVRGIGYRMERA